MCRMNNDLHAQVDKSFMNFDAPAKELTFVCGCCGEHNGYHNIKRAELILANLMPFQCIRCEKLVFYKYVLPVLEHQI